MPSHFICLWFVNIIWTSRKKGFWFCYEFAIGVNQSIIQWFRIIYEREWQQMGINYVWTEDKKKTWTFDSPMWRPVLFDYEMKSSFYKLWV